MTTRTAGGAPPGMPAHLWEAAKQDVRGVIPDWLRSARENGADAPPHIREVARRAARAGAGLGVAIAVGTGVHSAAAATSSSGLGGTSGPVAAGLPADAVVDPAGPSLAEAYRVPDPQAAGHELSVEMYQDVVVKEGAAAGYDVDAFQYLVVSDDAGRSYVFKEHHHAALAEAPARENDLLIHERGQVHVVENPDGSFSVDTVGYDRSVRDADDEPVAVPDDVPEDPFAAPPPTAAAPPAGFDDPEPFDDPQPFDDLDPPEPDEPAGDVGGDRADEVPDHPEPDPDPNANADADADADRESDLDADPEPEPDTAALLA